MGTTIKPISYEDSLTMPENRLEEIVHGESRIMPPGMPSHVVLLKKLERILEAQIDEREYVVFSSGAGVGIERNPLTYRIPDLAVYRREAVERSIKLNGVHDPYLWTVPEFLVECLSPSNRKGAIQELLADYARLGVPEVWLLDPKKHLCEVYRHESGAMHKSGMANSEVLSLAMLSHVTVALNDLWAAFGL